MTYAGFWRRFGAAMVDTVVMTILSVPAALAVLGLAGGNTASFNDAWPVVAGILNWLYFAGMESSAYQATFGKKALGLIVTDEAGDRIGFGCVFRRCGSPIPNDVDRRFRGMWITRFPARWSARRSVATMLCQFPPFCVVTDP